MVSLQMLRPIHTYSTAQFLYSPGFAFDKKVRLKHPNEYKSVNRGLYYTLLIYSNLLYKIGNYSLDRQ